MVESGQCGRPRLSVGAEKPADPVGRERPSATQVPGDRLVSLATVLFLFIETLSGLIIRSLQQLLLLAIVGK